MTPYTLTRSKRKTVSIHIKNGKVEVKAPLKFPQADIDKFVKFKERWITDNLAKSAELKQNRDSFTLNYGDKILYHGEEYPIAARDGNRVGFDDNLQQFYVPKDLTSEQIKAVCVQIYKMLAKKDLINRTLEFAEKMGVKPFDVKISSARKRWGSCSSSGFRGVDLKNINYSWRLILADDDVIDYVVVHELAHITEMNHSERFWAIVESVIPDYKERQERLKTVSRRLSKEDWEYNPDNDYFTAENGECDTKMKWHYADYKTILSPKNGMNLYRGCTHNCIYCDSRSACYQMNHDFCDIEVKRNAVQILEQQLLKKRNPCQISTGAMCDPYIHLEEELQLTRQCLEIIEKHGFGVSILTKSNRILRDIDLLQKINKKTKCVVQMTMTTFDDELCRIVEPNVSVTSERFDVLMKMKKAGIPTVVWLCPLLPFINDTEENLRGILDYCVHADVKGIMFWNVGMTLREGNREYFYSKLDELYQKWPGMKQKYIRTFGNNYNCVSPNNSRLTKIFKDTCIKHNILHNPDDVFHYLGEFEDKAQQQLSLFDLE